MDFKINIDSLKDLENNDLKIDAIKFQKMLILFNKVEDGWNAKKRGDAYVFTKAHEGKKEVLEDAYLLKFMKTSLDLNKIFS